LLHRSPLAAVGAGLARARASWGRAPGNGTRFAARGDCEGRPRDRDLRSTPERRRRRGSIGRAEWTMGGTRGGRVGGVGRIAMAWVAALGVAGAALAGAPAGAAEERAERDGVRTPVSFVD